MTITARPAARAMPSVSAPASPPSRRPAGRWIMRTGSPAAEAARTRSGVSSSESSTNNTS